MAISPITGTPGFKTERSAAMRKVRKTNTNAAYLIGHKTIDGAKARDLNNTGDTDVLQPGLVMGKVTASGKYAPSFIGALTALHDTSVATVSLTIGAAMATELVRRNGATGNITLIGPPTAAGTVVSETEAYSAVNVTTGVVTITATAADFIAGSFVVVDDGAETPRCLIDDGYGIKVTDQDEADVDAPFCNPLIGGIIDSSQILDWPSDTSIQAWLVGQLNSSESSGFSFDHNV